MVRSGLGTTAVRLLYRLSQSGSGGPWGWGRWVACEIRDSKLLVLVLAKRKCLRKNASIEILQVNSLGVELRIGGEVAAVTYRGSTVARWQATRVALLTADHARSLVDLGVRFVFAERAARTALDLLGEAGVSYATAEREWFLWQPPGVLLVAPPTRSGGSLRTGSGPALFSRGTARVARALLLGKADDGSTIRDIARSTELSESSASRAVAALDSRRLLRVDLDAGDGRRRLVTVPDRGALLEALADDQALASLRTATWDVGVQTVEAAVAEIADTGSVGYPYALGELSGAALRTRFAEPAITTVWVHAADVDDWKRLLMAAPAPPGPGRVVIRVARDPVLFDWAEEHDGVSVADPVQLYLDCRNSSERAVETAAALRQEIVG